MHPEQRQGRGYPAEWVNTSCVLSNIKEIAAKLGNKWGIKAINGGKKGPQGMRTLDETQKKLYYL